MIRELLWNSALILFVFNGLVLFFADITGLTRFNFFVDENYVYVSSED